MNNLPHIHHTNSIIVVSGATASGKTKCAIEVAKKFNTVVISADSRQCFKELNIGVARPTEEELKSVPHYFIASNSIHEAINAAWYETFALNLLEKLHKKHNVVVVTGGTGLYIKALTQGLDSIPKVESKVRHDIQVKYDEYGIDWLKDQLQLHDEKFVAKGEMQNPQRMMRALEVVIATGKSILDFQTLGKKLRPFNILNIGLELPKEILYNRINNRVDEMVKEGLEVEAKRLSPCRNLNALKTVGYKELFDYFDGNITFATAVEKIKQNTRRYAKRQITWFKNQKEMHWLNAHNNDNLLSDIIKLFEKKIH